MVRRGATFGAYLHPYMTCLDVPVGAGQRRDLYSMSGLLGCSFEHLKLKVKSAITDILGRFLAKLHLIQRCRDMGSTY